VSCFSHSEFLVLIYSFLHMIFFLREMCRKTNVMLMECIVAVAVLHQVITVNPLKTKRRPLYLKT